MKKFKFQLETLLKVTKSKKEEAEIKFAEASRKVEELRAQLQVFLAEMQAGQREYEALTAEGAKVTIGTLMIYNDFINWKRQQIERQQQLILEARAFRQKCLDELLKLMNKLKSIEQLKEKRFRQYQAEALAEEQKMLDEIGLQLTMRNAKPGD